MRLKIIHINKCNKENNYMKGKYRGCDIEVERGSPEFLHLQYSMMDMK